MNGFFLMLSGCCVVWLLPWGSSPVVPEAVNAASICAM